MPSSLLKRPSLSRWQWLAAWLFFAQRCHHRLAISGHCYGRWWPHTHAIFIMIEQCRLTANEHYTTIIQISSRMCACVLAQQIVIKGNLCVSTHFAQNFILSAASVHTIKEGGRASNWPRRVVVADLLLLYGGGFSTIIIIIWMTLILKQSLTVIDFQLTLPLTLCFSRCSPLRVFANPSKTGRFATLCSHYN